MWAFHTISAESKKIFFVLTIVVQMISSNNCKSQTYDVRATRWGMTMQEVIESEGSDPESNEKGFDNDVVLSYTLFIESRKVNCNYHFLNGRLTKVSYRYYWGSWQDDQKKDFKSRYYSISSFFKSLTQKNYHLSYGWHILNEEYSETGKKLSTCLGDLQFKTPFADLNKVEACFNQVTDLESKVNSSARIEYKNQRTRIVISFPLKNHEYKDKIIGWVTFESIETKTDF